MGNNINSSIKKIDLHGYSPKDARMRLLEEIEKYRKQGVHTIKVIHGFNHGTKIKDWLKSSKSIYSAGNVKDVFDDPTNSGVTYVIF